MPSRIVKASVCQSATLARLSAGGERLFYRLLTQADDYGVARAEVPIVKGACLPLVKCNEKDVERWLLELGDAGIVTFYSHGDREYLQFKTFAEHNRAPRGEPRNPLPPSDGQCPAMSGTAGQSQLDRDRDRDRERIEKRGKPATRPAPLPEDHPAHDLCKRFKAAQEAAGRRTAGKLEAWAVELDKIHRLDGFTWETIGAVLAWVPTDDTHAARGDWTGWAAQVRSLAGLRKEKSGESKWSKLVAAWEASRKTHRAARSQPHGVVRDWQEQKRLNALEDTGRLP